MRCKHGSLVGCPRGRGRRMTFSLEICRFIFQKTDPPSAGCGPPNLTSPCGMQAFTSPFSAEHRPVGSARRSEKIILWVLQGENGVLVALNCTSFNFAAFSRAQLPSLPLSSLPPLVLSFQAFRVPGGRSGGRLLCRPLGGNALCSLLSLLASALQRPTQCDRTSLAFTEGKARRSV